ncbi:ShlB/FhaC/HecB family hemolysin secretion/activation protein [Vibrio quintilis]|uniref:Hemolysin transporter protein ShlB n=1 Tax=Vibrio quintilis TaxID=1117707 RepID=A0A1M7YYF9_9VIBR|nr:ShlB/FhaC/HecB family hemolysin secretion/activation protein [Vibrio quintilis]SHO57668.1 Hemolysin transporter protein ShlB precursor [Vibrio quintilis]
MKLVVLLTGLSGLVFCPLSVFAQNMSSPEAPHIRSEIEREQAQRLEQIQDAKRELQQLQSVPVIPQPAVEQDKQCFPVEKISFSGQSVFNREQLLAFTGFEPACIGLPQINEYLRRITNQYIAAGYMTSRAFLVPQDLTTKELKILILEGKLESLLFNGKPQSFLHFAFPFLTGKILNLREIEQGLDQVNRLSRYNAQIKLLPGTKTGFSIVDIQTQPGHWLNGSLGVNNVGQESTGEEQLNTTLNAENIIGILDQWSLSGSKSSGWSQHHDAQSLSLNVDIPYGGWNLNYRTTYSDYTNIFTKNDFRFDTNGSTSSHDLAVKWLFHRNAVSKSSFTLGINHRREKNYFLNTLLTTTSRNLSSAFLSFDYSTRIGRGFLTLSPRLTLGTDWFGGEDDRRKSPGAPRAQFLKHTLTGSYTWPVNPSLSLTSTIFGQWSDDTLYGGQRVGIGGQYSVRGFKDASISGDSGYYWRNDAIWQMGQLPYLGQMSLQWAIDTGSIVKDKRDRFERGSLLGTSLALQTRSEHLSSRLSVGTPLASPGRLDADDYVLYYQMSMAF